MLVTLRSLDEAAPSSAIDVYGSREGGLAHWWFNDFEIVEAPGGGGDPYGSPTTILDLTPPLPQTFVTTLWPFTAMNTDKFHFTWTPTAASTDATWGNSGAFYCMCASSDDGGVWVVNDEIRLYAAVGGSLLATSGALTWTAGLPIDVTIDRAGNLLTVAGATTGDGTDAISAGDIFTNVTLGVGVYPAGGFTLPASTISDIDDGVSHPFTHYASLTHWWFEGYASGTWTDEIGTRDLTQATSNRRPTAGTTDAGYTKLTFDSTSGEEDSLASASNVDFPVGTTSAQFFGVLEITENPAQGDALFLKVGTYLNFSMYADGVFGINLSQTDYTDVSAYMPTTPGLYPWVLDVRADTSNPWNLYIGEALVYAHTSALNTAFSSYVTSNKDDFELGNRSTGDPSISFVSYGATYQSSNFTLDDDALATLAILNSIIEAPLVDVATWPDSAPERADVQLLDLTQSTAALQPSATTTLHDAPAVLFGSDGDELST